MPIQWYIQQEQQEAAYPEAGDKAPEDACWLINCGPGWMPWIVSAPSSSAITASPGMPSVIVGMKIQSPHTTAQSCRVLPGLVANTNKDPPAHDHARRTLPRVRSRSPIPAV